MATSPSKLKRALWIVPIAGIAALAYWHFGAPASAPASNPAAGARPAVEVTAMTVEMQTIQLLKELPSRARAYKVAAIRPQASGIITKRLFEEGGNVSEGDVLYQIDPAPYKAAYDSAYADLNRSKTNAKLLKTKAERFTKLLKTSAVSQQAYEDAVSAYEQAKADVAVADAAVAAAQVNLNYTKVSAPISGRIGKSTITPGALVTANQTEPLATITQLDPINVDLILPSSDLLELRSQFEDGQTTRVTLYNEISQSTYPHDGALQFSEVTVDNTTGTVLLRALFPNPERLLLPGMFLRARVHLRPKEALLVPQSAAVRAANGKLSVWVISKDGIVQPKPIVADHAFDNNWVVESGLDNGATIVTQGFQKIAPGVTVKPVFSKPSPSSEAKKVE